MVKAQWAGGDAEGVQLMFARELQGPVWCNFIHVTLCVINTSIGGGLHKINTSIGGGLHKEGSSECALLPSHGLVWDVLSA